MSALINIPDRYEVCLVLAVGKPREKVAIDETDKFGDIKYYRDDQQTHHVPKRKLEDIIIN